MGSRGPRPAPTALKLLRGEVHKDRINTDEPVPPAGPVEAPAHLNDDAKEVWDHTVKQLTAMRVLAPADRDALFAYCEAVAMHRRASRLLDDSAILIKAENGNMIPNPAVRVQRDAAVIMRGYAQEFGLTPSARSGIRRADAAIDDEANPERLFS